MVTDRELLEIAAKAAGYRIRISMTGDPYIQDGISTRAWNPLIDDGDALRLAHKLGMDVDMCACWVQYDGVSEMECVEFGSTLAEVRRAIVRAAAEIGRAMV